MDKITNQIYIGTSSDAKDLQKIKEEGINAILNCAHDLNREWYDNILSLKVGLIDGPYPYNKDSLILAEMLLAKLINLGFKVLIHCHNGVNRSPFLVSRTMANINGTDWHEEFDKIKKIRTGAFVRPWMENV